MSYTSHARRAWPQCSAGAVLLLQFLLWHATSAQPVNITGKVMDGVGRGLSGATVRLQIANLSTTSVQDGSFSITRTSAISNAQHPQTVAPVFSNARASFELGNATKISLSVFNIQGKTISTSNSTLPAGSYDLRLFETGTISGIFLVKLRIGDQQYVRKFSSAARDRSRNQHSQYSDDLRSALSKKTAILDTLQVTLAGYMASKTPISSLTGNYDIVLVTATSGPVIRAVRAEIDQSSYSVLTGATLAINVPFKNIGTQNGLSVNGVLSSSDPYIAVLTANAGYNNIAKDSTTTNLTKYSISVLPTIPRNHRVLLNLNITDSWGGQWSDTASLMLNAGRLNAEYMELGYDTSLRTLNTTTLDTLPVRIAIRNC